MKVDVLLGLQWGDEGKGKVVDVLTPKYDVITRFQGGPNAGHTLEFDNQKFVLHNIPSGIFREGIINVIGNGVVLDPVSFKKEIDGLSAKGFDLTKNLYISKKAHLILPTHRILDAASEASKGDTKIGSTLKGIGPTYMDKTGRNGLRVGDILHDFDKKYAALKEKHIKLLEMYDFDYNIEEFEAGLMEGIENIKKFKLIDSEHELNGYINEGKSILAEGAQGTLLDIDFGSYPFVTSSNTVCAGACTGMGIAPNKIGEVFGIFKAYCTRVGSGPFPTELFDEVGENLRKNGNEFGSTTGRPRRCGWLDLVALKYSVMINGVTKLIMMKGDVLSDLETIKVATAYKIDDEIFEEFPYELPENLEPVYTELPGWKCDLTGVRSENEFPEELNLYIDYLERELGIPISIVSVGPDREQTIVR
ncbi:adenylosuccinate synthase [Alkalitalea saponilacus]|uniref:Adenylosuccinate synthetase n=1 Tax=Alkalitalea saponilacus TaxID=889453 RepID=A0A1T5CPA4_9BACT|nr:adenylosuccinate synthase [Alkalitalea saponilacus]ASB49937.1 adenylosuccinate synthase [Alkalitalea saponilacus]SKB61302.1 Adenylosuccinate synthetase [Alkalitalea saponilacus]